MLQSETDIADAIKAATDGLHIVGGGTRPIGRPVDGIPLSVAGLSGITLYEPGSLTLVAKAGTPLAEIETALAGENQRLAFEPMDHRTVLGTKGTPTIGGVVAANVSGPRRISVGACRDFLLGVRFVNGSGEIVKNGGRVMKNVTGYDLVKLMAGSYGTLGAMTEVSLKVLPNVEAAATLTFADLPLDKSIALMSRALGSPFEVTGAARTNDDTHLRIEGFAGSVAYRSDALRTLLKDFGEANISNAPKVHAKTWSDVKDVKGFAKHTALWRVSLRPSQSAAFINELQQSYPVDYALDWGGGLIWVAAKQEQMDEVANIHSSESGAATLHTSLQQSAASIGGHATLIKGPIDLRKAVPSFQPESAGVAVITQGLRARFDPRGILNPGLMT